MRCLRKLCLFQNRKDDVFLKKLYLSHLSLQSIFLKWNEWYKEEDRHFLSSKFIQMAEPIYWKVCAISSVLHLAHTRWLFISGHLPGLYSVPQSVSISLPNLDSITGDLEWFWNLIVKDNSFPPLLQECGATSKPLNFHVSSWLSVSVSKNLLAVWQGSITSINITFGTLITWLGNIHPAVYMLKGACHHESLQT